MVIPTTYRKDTATTIGFDFKEFATKTGVILLSGFATETSGGLDYHLTTDETVYSSSIETKESGAAEAQIDLDFDAPDFQKTVTIEGTAICSFTIRSEGDAGTTASTNCITYIRKWDGTTETAIASATSPSVISGSGASTNELMTIPITIPRTTFKKGETLRVSMLVTATRTGGGNSIHCEIGHDPRNRDGTEIVPSTDDPDTITKLLVYMPFNTGF